MSDPTVLGPTTVKGPLLVTDYIEIIGGRNRAKIISGRGNPNGVRGAPTGSVYLRHDLGQMWLNISPHPRGKMWVLCCSSDVIPEPTFVIPDPTRPAAEAAFSGLCGVMVNGSSFWVEFTGVAIYQGAATHSVWKVHKSVVDGACRVAEYLEAPSF